MTNSTQPKIAAAPGSKLFEYLKNKAAQLADTLFEPVWRRILAWSWPARALVLLIVLGTAYGVFFPESATSAWRITSAVIRVVWVGESKIPIAASITEKTKESISRLSSTLESDLDLLNSDLDLLNKDEIKPWVVAQETVANYGIGNSPDTKRITSFIRSAAENTCRCWREIPENAGKPRNIFISGWILLALAQMGEPGTKEEVRFLLDEQHQDGWWSVFLVKHESQYASSYGTAWALLGLNSQITKGFVDTNDTRLVSAAIHKGSVWLLAEREHGSRWKDYPLLRNGKSSESISGVVLHALHQTVPKELLQIDSEWLDNLPTATISADDADHPYLYFETKDGYANDDFVQIRLPWLLIGTADAYRNGSIIQRAKALAWLEEALDQRSVVAADTTPDNWWRAELLYSLRYVLEKS